MPLKTKSILAICIAILVMPVLYGQDLVFTKPSSKLFTQEELRTLIREAAFEAVSRQKVPQALFNSEYAKIEKELWAASRTQIIHAFRWVDNASDALLRGTRKDSYKQALSQAVYNVMVSNSAFSRLMVFDQTDRIISFTSDVKVQRDGWLAVSEFITIYNGSGEQSPAYMKLNPNTFQDVNNDIQRGLERTFPTDYTNEYGLQTKVPFEVSSVHKNGQPENFMVVSYGNGSLLRIGSAEKYLEDGVYEYVITYKTKLQLKFKETKTELYWSVNGNGWVFTADSVQSQVTFPSGSKIFENACYTGLQGSKSKDCYSKIVNDSTIWFFNNKQLASYEGLTIAAAIQPGVITPPSFAETSINIIKYNWALTLIALVVVVTFIINLRNWFKFGRDPRKGVIYPGFEPPTNSPADAGFIYNQKYKTEQFSAALIDLAVKKGISIQVEKEGSVFKKNTYTFRSGKSSASVKNFARSAFNWNLDNLHNLKADGSYNSTFESLNSSLKEHLTNKYQIDGANKNKSKGLFALNSTAATWGFTAWFITVIFAVVTIGPIATTTLIVSASVLLGLGFISQYIFYKIMPAYNQQGRKLLDELLGFRMYLATAEEKRFDKLNPPEKNLELFERFLPYAVALDCQHEWANKFEDILKKAIADKSYQPSYFNSNDMNDSFSFSSISDTFSSSLSSTIASSSSAPSDSSDSGGSDGGGSSGGGGGGGGGGGW